MDVTESQRRERELEAARARYNALFPDAPITRIGNGLERNLLLDMEAMWSEGTPLPEGVRRAIEAVAPPGAES